MTEKDMFVLDEDSGIKIAADLNDHCAPVSDLQANEWNPNKMDSFMREKLANSIRKDGFIIPVLVRPGADADWEIIDGEHRWLVAKEELGMSRVPILNLGAISDSQAKEITIKANTLRGEFDSIELGRIVQDLIEEQGMDEVASSLPYTSERLQGMVDLLATEITDLDLTETEETEEEKTERASSSSDFDTFDPSDAKFDNQCPRCGFEFNNPVDKKEE